MLCKSGELRFILCRQYYVVNEFLSNPQSNAARTLCTNQALIISGYSFIPSKTLQRSHVFVSTSLMQGLTGVSKAQSMHDGQSCWIRQVRRRRRAPKDAGGGPCVTLLSATFDTMRKLLFAVCCMMCWMGDRRLDDRVRSARK